MQKRIALVHDYFTQQGGAERVAEQLHCMLPSADVFATVALQDQLPTELTRTDVQTSWMQRLPGMTKLHRYYFPLYPFGVHSLDLSGYDVIITSSSGYAKGVKTRREALHVCYCHTPMRWAWRYQDYAAREKFSVSARLALPLLLHGLRMWDMNASRQPDQFVANSQIVADRIQEIYHRHAVVIPPPIDVARFAIGVTQDDYYLVLSRLVPYKRIDLAVQACNLLKRRLIVVGDGPDRKRLEESAGPTVRFMGRLPDEEIAQYASGCRALLFPGEEDFGMVPLEVAAAGRPTVAFRAGGATETVIDKVTGTFFDHADPRSLASAIEELESLTWSRSALRRHALTFDVHTFRRRFMELLKSLGVSIPSVESIDRYKALERIAV
jgi:glycosyltransferase involved in cell wall biosynthesis